MKNGNTYFFSFLCVFSLVYSCEYKKITTHETQKKTSSTAEKKVLQDTNTVQAHTETTSLKKEHKLIEAGLVDIQEIDPSILVELKYATSDNFMKRRLYTQIDKAYLQKDVALRLAKVQEYLKKLRPDLSLLVYDGMRPLSIQQEMWDALDTIPVKDRVKFVSNPKNGSIHNYGAAVDLTIADKNGKAIDMGAGYDDIREIAYPRLEAQFLASGELSIEQVNNRKLLRKVMTSQGFTNIPTEWWHFNACSRNVAKQKYKLIE